MKLLLGFLLALFSDLSHSSGQTDEWFAAARNDEVMKIEALLQQAPSLLNLRDGKGYTALVLSSYHNHRALTLKLKSFGADPCLPDLRGNTALMGVIFKGHRELIIDLIGSCAVDHRNNEGQTALMYASLFGREDTVKLLIERGAHVDLTDHEGRTALTLAEGQWNKAMVSLLKTFNVIEK